MSSLDPNISRTITLFTWKIKNFDMCTQETGQPLLSPEFSPFPRQKVRYQIRLYPRGFDKYSANHLSVFIFSPSNEAVSALAYSYEIGIMTASGNQSLFTHTGPPKTCMGLKTFLDRKSLSSAYDKHDCALLKGDLTLYCAIKNCESAGRRQTTFPNAELLQLSEAFGKAYEEGLLTDMELQTKGETLKVHRAMIETRFPLLTNLQHSDLANIEGKTVGALLSYIYTGRLKKSDFVNSPDLFSHIKSLLDVRSRNIEAETIVSRKSVSFKWNVKRFRSLTSDDLLAYSMFGGDFQSWLNFTLTVSSNETSDDDYVLFSVTRYSQECKRIICKISYLDKCNTFQHTFGEKDCWKIPAFARRGEIVDKGSDMASFLFEVSLTDGKSTSCVHSIQLSEYSTSSEDTFENLKAYRDDLRMMLKDWFNADVQLISSLKNSQCESRFPCHRFVLAARSPGFRKKLEMCENLKEIQMGPVEPRVIKSMLHYLYTGMIQDLLNLEQSLDLYELANSYDIPGLKKESVRRVKSVLSADALWEVLIAADKWNDAEMKECVFDFVCKFPQIVLKSTRFQEELGSRSDLALEILNRALACLSGENKEIKQIEEPD